MDLHPIPGGGNDGRGGFDETQEVGQGDHIDFMRLLGYADGGLPNLDVLTRKPGAHDDGQVAPAGLRALPNAADEEAYEEAFSIAARALGGGERDAEGERDVLHEDRDARDGRHGIPSTLGLVKDDDDIENNTSHFRPLPFPGLALGLEGAHRVWESAYGAAVLGGISQLDDAVLPWDRSDEGVDGEEAERDAEGACVPRQDGHGQEPHVPAGSQ